MDTHAAQITWSWPLILMSYVVSVFGAFTSLYLAVRIPQLAGRARVNRLLLAAVAMGGGAIWAMHFIGMVAAKMDMPVRYDVPTTLASLLVAVAVTGTGLAIVGSNPKSVPRLIAGGTFTGLGVAGMHYLGMAAMRMPARLTYDSTLVAASIGIAVVAAIAALWLAFTRQGFWQSLGSAMVMGLAVCGMHYTGMLAAKMIPTGVPVEATSISLLGEDLALYVFLGVISLLAVALFTVMQENLRDEPV